MALLNLEQLLEPLGEENPCGESMEYDALFVALESASRGKAEQQYGDNIIPAEPPDWAEVQRIGIQLAEMTKDLRVACFLARALLVREGLHAFAEGLSLISGYLDRYWGNVHPELDPDDDNDPTFRVNTLSSLNDTDATVRLLREAPLVSGPLGTFSLIDIEVAKGEMSPRSDEEPPNMANIEAAFEQAGSDFLREQRQATGDIAELVEAIEAQMTSLVGAAAAISLDNVRATVKSLHQVIEEQCNRMGVAQDLSEDSFVEETEETESDTEGAPTTAAPAARPASTEITSREDVIRTLDRLCKYYEKYEPSSPLPLLLMRAKRLASMSFLDIIKDLSPDALSQARAVGGFFDDVAASNDQE